MNVLRFEPGVVGGNAQEIGRTLLRALRALPSGSLPLGSSCRQGGMVDESDLAFSMLTLDAAGDRITARVGVFFSELVGGCNCNDDPVVFNAYGVLRVAIDRITGVATISPDTD